MEQTQETVVHASVDAEQENQTLGNEATETETTVENAVDAQKPDNVGEAIKREVERRLQQENKKIAQEARDALIAERGYVWNGKPITTEAEYKEALREQELIEQYKSKELPEDVVNELVESRKFREKMEAERKTQTEQQQRDADFKAFIEAFPDVKPADIPQSVWEDVAKGKSLVDAYTRHENQLLKEQLGKLSEKEKTEQQNEENANSSTGSVTGQGETNPVRFTREQVAKMSDAEVNQNWAAIQESMKTWE